MAYVHPAILVIDGDAAVRDDLAELLRSEGYAVETASGGREALNRLRGGFHPCIILMDLMMTEMSAPEFRREQMADPELAKVPLVAYSGITDLAIHAQQLRANAYIQKPAELSYIMAAVRQHCLK